MLRFIVLATSLMFAGSALATQQETNKITNFTGLGDGGGAIINPGLYTTDGAGSIDLHTGTDPAAYGTVTFVLNSNTNRTQPCVFGFAVGDQFWPLTSQIGWLASDPTKADVTMYWRAAELNPGALYSVKFVCPAKVNNSNGNH